MKYTSEITLGNKYRDDRTNTEGFAIATSIFQYGCERTTLEWTQNDGVHTFTYDAPRIADGTSQAHESEIIFGEEYKDKYTGIKGTAAVLTFHENARENVTLEYKDKDGNLQELYLDVGRVEPVSREAKQEHSATQERRETPVKTGGPARATSHIRSNPVTRR